MLQLQIQYMEVHRETWYRYTETKEDKGFRDGFLARKNRLTGTYDVRFIRGFSGTLSDQMTIIYTLAFKPQLDTLCGTDG